jgi:hypothetical protein
MKMPKMASELAAMQVMTGPSVATSPRAPFPATTPTVFPGVNALGAVDMSRENDPRRQPLPMADVERELAKHLSEHFQSGELRATRRGLMLRHLHTQASGSDARERPGAPAVNLHVSREDLADMLHVGDDAPSQLSTLRRLLCFLRLQAQLGHYYSPEMCPPPFGSNAPVSAAGACESGCYPDPVRDPVRSGVAPRDPVRELERERPSYRARA